jgi:hypothetical protein
MAQIKTSDPGPETDNLVGYFENDKLIKQRDDVVNELKLVKMTMQAKETVVLVM